MEKLGLDMKIHVLWHTFCDSNLGNPCNSNPNQIPILPFVIVLFPIHIFRFTRFQCGMECLELSNFWEASN